MSDSTGGKSSSIDGITDLLELSNDFPDFSNFNSDISDKLHCLMLIREVESPHREHASSAYPDEIEDMESMLIGLVEAVVRSYVDVQNDSLA